MAAVICYTADMVRAMPDDGNRYEVVYGELLMTPAPRLWHQELAFRLAKAIDTYLETEPVGRVVMSPADISWGPDVLVQPDVFVAPARARRSRSRSRRSAGPSIQIRPGALEGAMAGDSLTGAPAPGHPQTRHRGGDMAYTPLDRPESVPTRFVEAWNNRDPETLAALFDEDAEFVNVVGLWWHDREAIRQAHAYGLERIFNRSTLRLGAVRVKRLSDDIAVVRARMRLDGQTPVGAVASPQPRTNIFSFVVHQTPDGWRCASAHNTDVVPGAETNVIDERGRFRSADYRRPELGE